MAWRGLHWSMAGGPGRMGRQRVAVAGALIVPVLLTVSVPARAHGALRGAGRPMGEQFLTREQAEAGLPARLEGMRGREAVRRGRATAADGRGRLSDRGRVAPPHTAPRPPVPAELEQ